MTRKVAANVLLAAGGLLTAIAAVVFAAVSWDRLGIGGRAGILALLSVAALSVAWWLRRRGLTASAEAVAAVGLVLTMLGALLAPHLVLADTRGAVGLATAAVICAVLAAGWAACGVRVGLRGPGYAAIGVAQPVLPLAALAAEPRLAAAALAMVAASAADLLLAGRRTTGWARAALIAAAAMWTAGVLMAVAAAIPGQVIHQPVQLALVLVAGACVSMLAAWRLRQGWQARPVPLRRHRDEEVRWAIAALAGASGVLTVLGIGLPFAARLPGLVQPAVFALAGTAVAVAGWLGSQRLERSAAADPARASAARGAEGLGAGGFAAGGAGTGGAGTGGAGTGGAVVSKLSLAALPQAALAAGAATVLAVTGLAVLSGAVLALAGPFGWVSRVWAGAPGSARAALTPGAVWSGPAVAPGVLALISLLCWWGPVAVRHRSRPAGLAVAALACVAVPVAVNLPYPAALTAVTVLAGVLLMAGALLREQWLGGTAAVAGATVAAMAAAWSLTSQQATFATLAVVLACLVVSAAVARTSVPAAVSSGGAVAAAAGLASAVAAAQGPAAAAGFALLGTGGAAQLAAALLTGRRQAMSRRVISRPAVSCTVEMAGWQVIVAAATVLLRAHPPAAPSLAAAGLVCLCTAAREARRLLLWPGLALLEAALCVQLAAGHVHAPEPYLVPVAVTALVTGWRWSRRVPRISSWEAYGLGLGLLLLPSLSASWQGSGWPRPLLLGVVAAAVLLAGARARLQAPLLLGGAVTVLDAGRELASPVATLAGQVPGWVPLALAGVAMIAVGATYEARMRELGKVRAVLAGMR